MREGIFKCSSTVGGFVPSHLLTQADWKVRDICEERTERGGGEEREEGEMEMTVGGEVCGAAFC